jgi:beta-glucanase (GH16 family)
MFVRNTFFAFALSFGSLCLIACQSGTTEPASPEAESSGLTIQIEAEDFANSSLEPLQEPSDSDGKQVRFADGDGWLQYELRVPTAGRYAVEARLSTKMGTEASVWVEDYVDNPDGRTYNITGNLLSGSGKTMDAYGIFRKDGSPLDSGLHLIRLHVSQGIAVDWLNFTLLRPHQDTPESLTQQTEGTEWEIVWADEFEGAGLPDSTKWTYDLGNWGWGNNEPQYYTEGRTENARQEGGNLIIEARKADMGQAWTSARLTTRGKVSFLYGKIEFRAKVPAMEGTWSAGWTLGDAYRDESSWPYCGEIDILETVGFEIDDESGDGQTHASCHTRAYYFKQGNQITSQIPVENMNGEFHTYAIEWSPEGVFAFLDDEQYFTYDKTANQLEWPFDQPQNLILNLAMGGGWGGDIDPTITSQELVVDYVRVYGRK